MNKKSIITILLAMLLIPVGMEAKKKEKKDEVPQLLNYPSAEVSEYRLHGGEVVIKGQLAGREGDELIPDKMLQQINGRFKVIVRDYIVDREKTSLIEFKPDGTFSMNIYVPYPMFVLVYPLADAYACPGDTLEMTITPAARTREEGIAWSGTGLSGEVTKLYEKIRTAYLNFPQEKVYEQGPDSVMKWKDAQVARLDDMVRQMNAGLPELEGCSPLASDILRTHVLSQFMLRICDPYMLVKQKAADQEAYWQQYFSFVAPREKYLLDNPLLMISADDFFFNRIEYEIMRPLYTSRVMYLPFDYDPKIAEEVEKENNVYRREAVKRMMDYMHDKLHISPTDFCAQVSQLRKVFTRLKSFNNQFGQAADDVANVMPVITHPELIRRAVLTYREYVKESEANTCEDRPMTKGDSIFQRIIEPYRGNVLYVDFWQMSCGPCRALMLSMRNEVEANKDKPVKYLYITDDTPEKCRSFLEPNNIQGEHIHITPSEWGYLSEKFQFSAIPFTLIFDKDGKRRDNTTVEELLKEMGK